MTHLSKKTSTKSQFTVNPIFVKASPLLKYESLIISFMAQNEISIDHQLTASVCRHSPLHPAWDANLVVFAADAWWLALSRLATTIVQNPVIFFWKVQAY